MEVFGAGEDSPNPGKFAFSNYFTVSNVARETWLIELNEICRTQKIDYIFPAHDDVIVALAERSGEVGASVISSPPETCRITRSKSTTYNHLRDFIAVPAMFRDESEVHSFPVLVKPDKGQGSVDITVVENHKELKSAIANVKDPIICEYLPGEEFTVDCFTSRKSGLLFAAARERRRVRNGISVNSITVPLSEAREIAESINAHMALCGAWFFQIKRAENGTLKLLEVAPRIAGTMALHRALGVNFALLSIFEHEGLTLQIIQNNVELEIDRALQNRFRHNMVYDHVYIDYDDTVVLNGKVNIKAIGFLYHAFNVGKRLILISKHQGNLESSLKNYRLDTLFDEVIHVPQEHQKSDYIRSDRAIFIDDSFSERLKVANKHNIPTFDLSMIEMLFD